MDVQARPPAGSERRDQGHARRARGRSRKKASGTATRQAATSCWTCAICASNTVAGCFVPGGKGSVFRAVEGRILRRAARRDLRPRRRIGLRQDHRRQYHRRAGGADARAASISRERRLALTAARPFASRCRWCFRIPIRHSIRASGSIRRSPSRSCSIGLRRTPTEARRGCQDAA